MTITFLLAQRFEPSEFHRSFNGVNSSFAALTSIQASAISSSPSTLLVSSRVVNVTMTLPPKLQLSYYIIVALTGLIGNITTIIVFAQRRLRSLRSSFFLTCLAITDLVFILILIIALLDELDVPIMTAPVCILTIYFSHIASFLSSNFTLAYTIHRLIAVLFPIKATTFLKQRTNRILALVLISFAGLFYSISFAVTSTRFRSNSTNVVSCEEDQNKALLFPFLVLDTLFTFLIPFSLITVMNLTIVYQLRNKLNFTHKVPIANSTNPKISPSARSSTNSSGNSITEAMIGSPPINLNNLTPVKTESHRLLQQQNLSLLSVRPIAQYKSHVHRPTNLRHFSSYQTNTSIHIRSTQCRATSSAKTTKMLLAASTVFLVFNLPYHLLLFCFLFIENEPPWMLNAVNIARLWFFASFCVNFFVYAICGQRFRSEVVRLFSFSSFRRYLTQRQQQKNYQERHNSIYLSHRLLPMSLTRLSH